MIGLTTLNINGWILEQKKITQYEAAIDLIKMFYLDLLQDLKNGKDLQSYGKDFNFIKEIYDVNLLSLKSDNLLESDKIYKIKIINMIDGIRPEVERILKMKAFW